MGAATVCSFTRFASLCLQNASSSLGLLLEELHAKLAAGSQLVGLDINPAALALGEAAANKGIKLIQHDINDPLPEDLKNKFDIVHVRFTMYGSGRTGLEAVVKNLASALKSGGWLQVQEHSMTAGHGNSGPAINEYISYFDGLVQKMGMNPSFCESLKPSFEAAGLSDVSLAISDTRFGKGAIDEAESLEVFTQWVPVLGQYGKSKD